MLVANEGKADMNSYLVAISVLALVGSVFGITFAVLERRQGGQPANTSSGKDMPMPPPKARPPVRAATSAR